MRQEEIRQLFDSPLYTYTNEGEKPIAAAESNAYIKTPNTTSDVELRRQIMDTQVPKNKRECCAAAKYIEVLECALKEIAVRSCAPLDNICTTELPPVSCAAAAAAAPSVVKEPKKKNLYIVTFMDEFVVGRWAYNEDQAKILAQAKRIKCEDSYTVNYTVKRCTYIACGQR